MNNKGKINHFLFHLKKCSFDKQNPLFESFRIDVKALKGNFQPNFDKKVKAERENIHLLLCKSLKIKVILECRPASILHLKKCCFKC